MVVKRYLSHVKSKTPHHRRQHAAQVAGVLTALAFVVWITTLGVRFANTGPIASDGSDTSNGNQTMLAGAGTDTSNSSGIEVVGTTTADSSGSLFSDYSNQGSNQ